MLAWLKSIFKAKDAEREPVIRVDREGVAYLPVRQVVLKGKKPSNLYDSIYRKT